MGKMWWEILRGSFTRRTNKDTIVTDDNMNNIGRMTLFMEITGANRFRIEKHPFLDFVYLYPAYGYRSDKRKMETNKSLCLCVRLSTLRTLKMFKLKKRYTVKGSYICPA